MKFAGQIFLRRFLLPFFLAIILLAVGLFAFGRFALVLSARKAAYEQYLQSISFLANSTGELRGNLPRIEYLRWQSTQDAATLFTSNLDSILREAPPGSIVRESVSITPGSSFLGFQPGFSVYNIELSLSGNFLGLQETLLKLEMLLPNLFLLEVQMEHRMPDSGNGKEQEHIFANVKYALIGGSPQNQ